MFLHFITHHQYNRGNEILGKKKFPNAGVNREVGT